MEFETLPFTVVVDTREQHPWAFRGFRHDADRNNVPMVVPVEHRALDTGDYSISGLEQRIAIERKSLEDLYNTVIHGRDRFKRELDRMRSRDCSAVIIESGLLAAMNNPPANTKIKPKSVYRSILSWTIEYPTVHWWWCDTRVLAEKTSLNLMRKFWKKVQEEQKDEGDSCST